MYTGELEIQLEQKMSVGVPSPIVLSTSVSYLRRIYSYLRSIFVLDTPPHQISYSHQTSGAADKDNEDLKVMPNDECEPSYFFV